MRSQARLIVLRQRPPRLARPSAHPVLARTRAGCDGLPSAQRVRRAQADQASQDCSSQRLLAVKRAYGRRIQSPSVLRHGTLVCSRALQTSKYGSFRPLVIASWRGVRATFRAAMNAAMSRQRLSGMIIEASRLPIVGCRGSKPHLVGEPACHLDLARRGRCRA